MTYMILLSMADCSKRCMITAPTLLFVSLVMKSCYHYRLITTFIEWTTPRHLYSRVHCFRYFVWSQSINSCKASIWLGFNLSMPYAVSQTALKPLWPWVFWQVYGKGFCITSDKIFLQQGKCKNFCLMTFDPKWQLTVTFGSVSDWKRLRFSVRVATQTGIGFWLRTG